MKKIHNRRLHQTVPIAPIWLLAEKGPQSNVYPYLMRWCAHKKFERENVFTARTSQTHAVTARSPIEGYPIPMCVMCWHLQAERSQQFHGNFWAISPATATATNWGHRPAISCKFCLALCPNMSQCNDKMEPIWIKNEMDFVQLTNQMVICNFWCCFSWWNFFLPNFIPNNIFWGM